jgi:hypothetical protein
VVAQHRLRYSATHPLCKYYTGKRLITLKNVHKEIPAYGQVGVYKFQLFINQQDAICTLCGLSRVKKCECVELPVVPLPPVDPPLTAASLAPVGPPVDPFPALPSHDLLDTTSSPDHLTTAAAAFSFVQPAPIVPSKFRSGESTPELLPDVPPQIPILQQSVLPALFSPDNAVDGAEQFTTDSVVNSPSANVPLLSVDVAQPGAYVDVSSAPSSDLEYSCTSDCGLLSPSGGESRSKSSRKKHSHPKDRKKSKYHGSSSPSKNSTSDCP